MAVGERGWAIYSVVTIALKPLYLFPLELPRLGIFRLRGPVSPTRDRFPNGGFPGLSQIFEFFGCCAARDRSARQGPVSRGPVSPPGTGCLRISWQATRTGTGLSFRDRSPRAQNLGLSQISRFALRVPFCSVNELLCT